MPKQRYTNEQLEEALASNGGSIRATAKELRLDRRNLLRRMQRNNLLAENTPVDDNLPDNAVIDKTKQRFILTCVMNDTPINEPFLKGLREYAEKHDAQLLCLPQRYKNPSLMSRADECVWPSQLDYVARDVELSERVLLAGCARPQATTSRPLAGYEGYGKGRSVIVGHSRVELTSVPRLLPDAAVYAISTGSISVPQFSDTKLGSLGKFHHVYAALLIEVDGENMWFRHLQPDEQGNVVDPLDDIDTLILGDVHVGHIDKGNYNAIRNLQAKKTVLHDLFDGYSISHHHEGNRFLRYTKRLTNKDNLLHELQAVATMLNHLPGEEKFIIESNHHDHLDKWLLSPKAQEDMTNLHLYYWLCFCKVDAIQRNNTYDTTSALRRYLTEVAKVTATFVGRNESLSVAGIELGQHGDRGANGSRTLTDKVRDRTIFGHRHTPSIRAGAMCVGTSSRLDLEYTSGYTSWAHVHAIISEYGNRTLFNCEAGRCRL